MHKPKRSIWLIVVPFLTSTLFSPVNGEEIPAYFSGNHGFLHDVGVHVPGGWSARYRNEPPGYFIRGRAQGEERLSAGVYRYRFYFALPPGRLGGLFRKANDVVRLEVWDRARQRRLAFRLLQQGDFPSNSKRLVPQTILFTVESRDPHPIEPRLYWPGLESLFLDRVELERLDDWSPGELSAKAERFEYEMYRFIDRGMVVARRGEAPEDVGDAAIWTGLYAAAEAWRYQNDHSSEALARMESALRALHALHMFSPQPGTLVRYVDAQGHLLPQPASKDTYTGFFFGIAQCWPWIRDPQLRADLQHDIETIAGYFLDNDLSFPQSDSRHRLEFNPYVSEHLVNALFHELTHRAERRRELISIFRWVSRYFRLHGQRGWVETKPMIKALRRNDEPAMRRTLLPLVRGAIPALRQLRDNVERMSMSAASLAPNTPYGRMLELLDRILKQLPPPEEIRSLSDVKVLPSESLHALHFIKTAAEILPKPNRFDAYYHKNLHADKALLKTVVDWMNVDEEFIGILQGRTQAAAHRSSNNHLTYLALYDLMTLERDASIGVYYQNVFLRECDPLQDEYNAMIEVMRASMKVPSNSLGLGWWSLQRYPVDRRGRGEAYWQARLGDAVARYGKSIPGQARDPIPLDERPRDCFIWQRSARSLRGDDAQIEYPPMDFLFVYWMARAHQLTPGED